MISIFIDMKCWLLLAISKLKAITRLPMNSIIYVTSSNFPYSFLLIHFSKYFEVKCYKSPILL